jgi:hypothetical protein
MPAQAATAVTIPAKPAFIIRRCDARKRNLYPETQSESILVLKGTSMLGL